MKPLRINVPCEDAHALSNALYQAMAEAERSAALWFNEPLGRELLTEALDRLRVAYQTRQALRRSVNGGR